MRVGALTRNAERVAELRALGVSEIVKRNLIRLTGMGMLKGLWEWVNCVSSAGGGLEGYRKSYIEGQKTHC